MRHIQPTRHAEIKRRPPPFVAPPRTTLPGDGRDLVAASAIPISFGHRKAGAGRRDRTDILSLEGCCTTIVLYPPRCLAADLTVAPPGWTGEAGEGWWGK